MPNRHPRSRRWELPSKMPLLCASVLPECRLSSSVCTSKLRLLLNHRGFWPLSELLSSQFGIAAAPFCYYRNSFHAKLPKSIGNMSNLEVFDADAYSIDGEIPLKIGNLTNLYTLSVYQNDLSGIIPTTIKGLQSLQYLHQLMSKNHLAILLDYFQPSVLLVMCYDKQVTLSSYFLYSVH
ncbi:leucine-rich repeat receptor-like serine/threonine-protein kinase BAM3 isoform X2 [Arachis ipaensis]|uniref:leucine-rich repeat receptor-like serine/threonine-protein kinase BAM3 isoform X2 n=1 Tax=Arachis ipaensis TaxID=130454 RepID=UPI000A2B8A01|nr:leucine-rich repeat receptor-like serine/threonine-protein kinase BAM3 isoform X2 [Arachis ipaensis]XP_025633223.1 receptor protein-tyrosine kinase CEPR1 isoform X2 [Arachis hypogaea]